ncbi:hypothetical protein O181_086140 [Austropuccinia psidii MF-1]|uniref:Uncharacterized protein n=1 Tax=Austropuccinia psidii MF-1 TaxID=1389203 RepID=A0A9Q3FYT1_9BASI|nr:hypothetical protein [Austropuccinia psidii MF-1]
MVSGAALWTVFIILSTFGLLEPVLSQSDLYQTQETHQRKAQHHTKHHSWKHRPKSRPERKGAHQRVRKNQMTLKKLRAQEARRTTTARPSPLPSAIYKRSAATDTLPKLENKFIPAPLAAPSFRGETGRTGQSSPSLPQKFQTNSSIVPMSFDESEANFDTFP